MDLLGPSELLRAPTRRTGTLLVVPIRCYSRTAKQPGAAMKRGDHIKVWRLGYTHHGIYIGGGWVIHFTGEVWAKLAGVKKPRVQRDRLSTFRGDSKVEVVRYLTPKDVQFLFSHLIDGELGPEGAAELLSFRCASTPDEVVARAKSRLGEEGYDLIWNNCEHFATECVTGEGFSDQVAVAGPVVAGGVAGGATQWLLALGPIGLVGLGALALANSLEFGKKK
jgi:hypothetical protein